MAGVPVILIFDIGKTNKKILLFDEDYKIVYEESCQLPEIKDEDDFPCENMEALTNWLKASFKALQADRRFNIRAVNFSAYGASLVYQGKKGKTLLPLYNYLKPYPENLQHQFYEKYGGENRIAQQTASPVLGNLNSGMQLYRIKYEKPELFKQIAFALHLPQYLSYILTDYPASDITSIGCHTQLWNFQENKYHSWVREEGLENILAPLISCNSVIPCVQNKKNYLAGIGLHDSSAALIPYLYSFQEPFILLSTGTWCISLNPFNYSRLTSYELQQDCLCYLSYTGKPVKASRLFAGYEHEQQVKRLAAHFNTGPDYYKKINPDFELMKKIKPSDVSNYKKQQGAMIGQSKFGKRKLTAFNSYEQAYHQLIADLIHQQIRSTSIVLKDTPVTRIFVDGGFSSNSIYMHLLADVFPGIEVYAASVAQASSLGAALAIHEHWNKKSFPTEVTDLKLFSPSRNGYD